jgi:hypothetical protein
LFHFFISHHYISFFNRIDETEENSDDYYLAFHVNSETMKLEFVSCGPGRVFDPADTKRSCKRFILIILSKENAKQLSSILQKIPSLKSKKDDSVDNKNYYLYVWNHFAEKFESKQKDLERTVCNELAETANLQSTSRPIRPPPPIPPLLVATTIPPVDPFPPTSPERPNIESLVPMLPATTVTLLSVPTSTEESNESPPLSLLAGSKLNGFFSYSKEEWKNYLIYPPELEALSNLQAVSRPTRPRANLQLENLALPNLNHPETTNTVHRPLDGEETQPIECNRQTSSPGSSTKRKRQEEESDVHCPCRESMETLLESFEARLSKKFQCLLEKYTRDLQEK